MGLAHQFVAPEAAQRALEVLYTTQTRRCRAGPADQFCSSEVLRVESEYQDQKTDLDLPLHVTGACRLSAH